MHSPTAHPAWGRSDTGVTASTARPCLECELLTARGFMKALAGILEKLLIGVAVIVGLIAFEFEEYLFERLLPWALLALIPWGIGWLIWRWAQRFRGREKT